jgi:hypothetical protein
MKKFPIKLHKGQTVKGRFGRHTNGTSPAWDNWTDHVVSHVQYDIRNNPIIYVVSGIEFCPYNYEGTVDDQDQVHCFNVEEIIFEFKL